MKKILVIAVAALCCINAHAQIEAPQQTDTLVVTSVKYNYADIQKENWPCDTIYKSATEFRIADKTYKIKSATEETFSPRYMAREISFKLEKATPLSYYENANQRVVVSSGYEFYCAPAQPKVTLKDRAKNVVNAADSIAVAAGNTMSKAGEKITEAGKKIAKKIKSK